MNLGRSSLLRRRKFIDGIEYTKNSNKLLAYSLMWMGLGVFVIALIVYLVSISPMMFDFAQGLNYSFFLVLVLQIATIFALHYVVYKRKKILWVLSLYLSFVIITGFFVSAIISIFIAMSSLSTILTAFFVPGLIFIIMGLLGYFKVFNFSKIFPFLIVGTVALLIMSFILWFTTNSWLMIGYGVLTIVVFSGWIGYDMYMIRRTNEEMLKVEGFTREDYIRYSTIFGAMLLIDLIQLIIGMIAILSSGRI